MNNAVWLWIFISPIIYLLSHHKPILNIYCAYETIAKKPYVIKNGNMSSELSLAPDLYLKLKETWVDHCLSGGMSVGMKLWGMSRLTL